MIYFIQADPPHPVIKIGCTQNWAHRVCSLRAMAGRGITVLGGMDGDRTKEAELHKRFKEHRVIGEWFDPHHELLKFISELPPYDFSGGRNLQKITELAIQKAGGVGKLAGSLKVSRQSIYTWKRIPVSRVLKIEELTGMPRHVLRPDIYDEQIPPYAPGAIR